MPTTVQVKKQTLTKSREVQLLKANSVSTLNKNGERNRAAERGMEQKERSRITKRGQVHQLQLIHYLTAFLQEFYRFLS